MDFLFGGGVGQTSSSLAAAATAAAVAASSSSSSVRDDDPISRIPTTSTTSTSTSTSSAATSATGSVSVATAAHTTSGATAAAAAAAAATSAHFSAHDNGPILYDNLNRTSAIDDIRSVVIYIFIITVFLSFFLILPGIRSGKFTTFLCVITSLLVTSIIIISLNGTTWHVGEAPISAPYKAFSRDRIQGDLGVRIGLQSVNISLRAQKYYILHATDGPMIMENTHKYSLLHQPLMVVMAPVPTSTAAPHQDHQPHLVTGDENPTGEQPISAAASTFIHRTGLQTSANGGGATNGDLAEDLLASRSSDAGVSVDTELETDEPFAADSQPTSPAVRDAAGVPVVSTRRLVRSDQPAGNHTNIRKRRQQPLDNRRRDKAPSTKPRYTVKRVYVDINYNERFYWIGPMQMRREYQQALERGLPYPILTVVEYLSQDDAGFNWSRQYRAAGYYTSMLLWVSASVCVLMFCLHCAAPKYGIYAMQALGVLLLLTNLNYATLVPKGDQKLVIPFEGQSLTFRFGWNFWLVLVGGCLSLIVGTTIVIIDRLFPNFIFTTVLDVDFDSSSQKTYYEKKYKILGRQRYQDEGDSYNNSHDRSLATLKKPEMPPFMQELKRRSKEKKLNVDKNQVKEVGKIVSNPVDHKFKQSPPSDATSENTSTNQENSRTEHQQEKSSNLNGARQTVHAEPTRSSNVHNSGEQTIRL